MEPFLYHVFICDQVKPEGAPACTARGAGAVIETLRREIAAQGMIDEVQLTTCGSLGLCEHGPNLVVYPDGIWYGGVSPEDVPEIVRSHFKEGTPVERLMRSDTSQLRAEILCNREKREAAMRARDASGSLPDELLQTLRAFQESRALLTAIELDVFSAVGGGASAESVAACLATDTRATEMLLNALAAIGMLSKESGIFHNTRTSARYFTAGSPDNSREGLMHTVHLWPRWSTLTDCIRAGTAVISRETGARDENWTHAFIAAMDRNAAERIPLVVRAVDLEGVHRMLDLGGGSGAYSIAFAQASGDLQVEILDLPEVVPITGKYVEMAGLTARIKIGAGDLRADPLGAGFDLVFVSAICHMLDPGENRDLFQRCCQALGPQGRLVVQDFILEPDKTSPKSAALFALNMLVGTRAGSSYSIDEYTAWMREAGFPDVKHIRLPGPTCLVVGTRG
ncbi:MAG: methyltransferase domain-containing protein [Acidobacteriia bacterium]|nr:methyltransferase domain-containing protein [Terriglobia bacterium]